MTLRDILILTAVSIICTLLYLATSLSTRCNRTKAGCRAIILSALVVLILNGLVWYIVFASPVSRNWGLGGAYLWIAVCPALYLFCGVAVTIRNLKRKENFHD